MAKRQTLIFGAAAAQTDVWISHCVGWEEAYWLTAANLGQSTQREVSFELVLFVLTAHGLQCILSSLKLPGRFLCVSAAVGQTE